MYNYLLYIAHLFQCVCARICCDLYGACPIGWIASWRGPVKAAKAAVSETRQRGRRWKRSMVIAVPVGPRIPSGFV